MKMAKYICFEGTEGVGKTTQTQRLVDKLRESGYRVLQTKEPGTSHSPLTMLLRGIMLDNKYDAELTKPAREFISQAIRSIHLEKVIAPAIHKYDFIIQDRGVLSGYSYGVGCGNEIADLELLTQWNIDSCAKETNVDFFSPGVLYSNIIYLKGDIKSGLNKAITSKQEFETGDAIESRGLSFINEVSNLMEKYSTRFPTVTIVEIDGKTIDQVHTEIIDRLGIKENNVR